MNFFDSTKNYCSSYFKSERVPSSRIENVNVSQNLWDDNLLYVKVTGMNHACGREVVDKNWKSKSNNEIYLEN